ncbi:MAG TPA: hypothetical protein PK863_06055 [Candidatus Dojkabacteria bacterium]|nr:hypothetical protein [Candidatus Dojkabacteria bacterium]HRP51782.1 hypothetical protein [Candidatus Dojkabacteria bacterium]
MNLLKFITPLNLHTEREKFLASDEYDPQFQYYWQNQDVEYTTQGDKLNLMKSIKAQDIDSIHKYAKLHFQMYDWEYVDLANQILSRRPSKLEVRNTNYIQIEFERVFKLFGLYEYSFKTVDKHGFSFRPNCHKKTLEMSKYASFQFFSIESEVKHEITHILRYENGIYNNIPRSDYYLATEEGLATYLQDLVTKDNYSLYQHSAEYMASKVGMNSSLREVYNYFISLGFEPELAWHRSSRHKFGFVDTSKPGDILKPAMYFAQSQNIAKLNQEEILKLFVGKISLKDSEKFDKYYGRFDYNDLKNYFFDNE